MRAGESAGDGWAGGMGGERGRGRGRLVDEQEHEDMIRQYEATLEKMRQEHSSRVEALSEHQ